MYPAGASPASILDMGGTIYEWCLNAFDDPANTAFVTSAEDHRVLRGGSWFDYQVNARAAVRISLNPNDRISFVGFRVVCSSPSSDTDL
jgi:formylglycine-generating enzyme required for sulfatase activity